MITMFQSWMREPRVVDAPPRVWRDWALVGGFMVAVLIEVILRDDINSRLVAVPLVVAIGLALLWRRVEPLTTFGLVFGSVMVFDLVSAAVGHKPSNIYSQAVLLIFMYSLFRWGSGRDMAIGTVLGLGLFIVSGILDYTGLVDQVVGLVVLAFPAATGLAIRFIGRSREQAREQIRVIERETLARELHDTVAHHVSAIVIQAQAGRFVAESGSLDGATAALEVIEEESSRTLAEMRSIVASMRVADLPAAMAPIHGLADIANLAAASGTPLVEVTIGDGLQGLEPAIGAALYRIAQESVTNARRHARNAHKVEVRVDGLDGEVRLTVTDDGDRPATQTQTGFGLIGMTERATLLRGTLDAGPAPMSGWQVQVVLPRSTQP